MMVERCVRIAAGGLGLAVAFVGAAAAQEAHSRPVVVEMFLSQSCKASPPAADSLRELAARRDIVALAWHVDYWNEFAAQRAGVWNDPYSSNAFSRRQREYNKRIRSRNTVFTPQAIVDGVFSVVGSDREAVEQRIIQSRTADELSRSPRLSVDAAPGAGRNDRRFEARIGDVGAPYDAVVVAFRPSVTTAVGGGDNAGAKFHEVNVVTGVRTLADHREGPGVFAFDAPAAGESCAVLVQERNLGRIVAARYCPQATAE